MNKGRFFHALTARGVAVAIAASALAAIGVASPVTAAEPALPCATTLAAPATVVDTKASGGPFQTGQIREYAVPAAWSTAVALLAQVSATSTRGTRIDASSTDFDARTILEGPTTGAAAGVVVPLTDGKFKLKIKTGAVDVVLRVWGYLTGPDCFNHVAPIPLVDTATSSGPVGAGSDLDIPVGAGALVPDKLDIGVVSLAVRNMGTAAATVDLVDAGGLPFARRVVPASRVATWTEFVPPTELGLLRLRVVSGSVNVRALPIGWMPPGIPFTSERLVLTSTGPIDARTDDGLAREVDGSVPPVAGTTKPPVTKFTLPLRARDATAVFLAATLRPASGQGGSLKVWRTGATEPTKPTLSTVAAGSAITQLIVVKPGNGTISARPTAKGMRWTLAVVGWSSALPGVNQPVDDATTLAADSVTVESEADPETGEAVVQYSGTQTLEPGDIIAAGASDANPAGLLAKVTTVGDSGASTSEAESVQTVTVEPATLADALPNYNFTQVSDVATPTPDPVADPGPLPPASPPGGTASARATASAAPPIVRANLSSGKQNPCAGGVPATIEANYLLTGRITLAGGYNKRGTTLPHASFDFNGKADGSVDRGISIEIDGQASCHEPLQPVMVAMSPITFNVGGIPVVVVPTARLDVVVNLDTDEAAIETVRGSATLDAGLSYANESWAEDRLIADKSLSATFDARHGVRGRVDAIVRVDANLYGVAGGNVTFGPYAKTVADVNGDPWWTVDGGNYAGAGAAFHVLGLDVARQIDPLDKAESRIATAPGPFPGPNPGSGNLPNGKVTVAYDQQLAATGGSGGYKWYRTSGSLPPGLAMSESGRITGTPTATGTSTFAVQPFDSAGNKSKTPRTISITIDAAPDRDGDGTPDASDRCPDQSGPSSNQGCPTDRDGDGVLDINDHCPDTPGPASNNGCPPPPPPPTLVLRDGVGTWYDIELFNFAPNSTVTLACHDSRDRNFYTETVRVNGSGYYRDTQLCFSADGPDHWVTGAGYESNHVGW